ncbi:hypothetical protein M9Y10_041170 [Tritrichomonas musculus]|uniref:AMP-dependent synthetase/ligase domain-containing protein n=1 Tax=Tritrichomonas musculus TaxID=1915356 RepID=A0ABR2K4E0_9EUKA
MGANYSQPPRGYQYSTQQFDNETDILEVAPEYSSFHEMYQKNYSNERNLPYLLKMENNEILSYSYDQCYNFSQNFISFLLQHQIKPNSTIAVFSEASFESQIVCNASLLFGYHLLLSSPSSIQCDNFCNLIKSYSPFAIFCSANDAATISRLSRSQSMIITDSDSKFNSFWKIVKSHSNSVQLIEQDDSFQCITYITNSESLNDTNTSISMTNSEIFKFISSWSEKLTICRDATIAAILSCDDNIQRLINFLCVHCRAKLCFPDSLNDVKKYKATHIFTSPRIITQEIRQLDNEIQNDHSFLFRILYNAEYVWKRMWVLMGSQSPRADKRVFNSLKKDFGEDLHFTFCTGQIDKKVHEAWLVLYGKPLCTIFSPAEWINVGSSLPCDLRFIKLGTLGGPVDNSVKIDEDTHKIGSRVTGVLLDKVGFWDEEGALVITN